MAGVAIESRRSGKAEAMGFFTKFGTAELDKLEPVVVLQNDSQVAVVINMNLTIKATGIRYQDTEVHLWTLDEDGKITGHRFFNDTAKVIHAHGAVFPV